jgi:hypothetical protein
MHGLNPKIEPKADIASGKHQRIATDTERNNVAAYGVFSGTHTGRWSVRADRQKDDLGLRLCDAVHRRQDRHMTKIWHSGMARRN